MNANHGLTGALLLVLMTGPQVLAQTPSTLPVLKESVPFTATADGSRPPSPAAIVYPEGLLVEPAPAGGACSACGISGGPNCCGPVGAHGPIGSEIYARTGPSFIISETAFGNALKTGYEVMGGGRSLFFNQSGTRAHTVDVGLSYTSNDGKPTNTFNFMGAPVTLRNLHRTAVSLAFGEDWFLMGPGNNGCASGCNLRFGADFGGRYGTSHLDMNIAGTDNNGYLRKQDVYAAGFAGVHLDLAVPMGAWTFLTGVRGEYSYTNTNLIPGTNTSLHDINVLLTMGIMY